MNHTTADTFGTLYLWGRPEFGFTLENWSLQVISDNPDAIAFATATDVVGQPAVDVVNPFLGTDFPEKSIYRWAYETEPVADAENPSTLDELQGFSIVPAPDRIGVGVGFDGGGGAYIDPFYNANTDSWLLATIKYLVKGAGLANVYLQIGRAGINMYDSRPEELTVILGALSDNEVFSLRAGPNSNPGRLTNSATPEAIIEVQAAPTDAADFDGDGDIDGRDFLTWQRGRGLTGTAATREAGDANGDAVVDSGDYALWRSQFGTSSGIGAVPEPTSVVLALWASALVCAVNRNFRWGRRLG